VKSSTLKVAKGELVFTSFLLAVSLIVLWDAITLVESGINAVVGPKAFAIAIGAILFVLSSIQIVAVLRGDRGEPEGIEGGELIAKSNWKALLIVISAILFHIFTLELLGFIVATVPLFIAIAYALGDRRWVRMVIVAIAVVVITFFVFREGLQLNIPVGFEFLTGETEIVEEEW
jgi:putative tricarboxylic transport membrane protein